MGEFLHLHIIMHPCVLGDCFYNNALLAWLANIVYVQCYIHVYSQGLCVFIPLGLVYT